MRDMSPPPPRIDIAHRKSCLASSHWSRAVVIWSTKCDKRQPSVIKGARRVALAALPTTTARDADCSSDQENTIRKSRHKGPRKR